MPSSRHRWAAAQSQGSGGIPMSTQARRVGLYWVSYRAAFSPPRWRLFAFPHAGGTSSVFRPWGAHLPPHVELCSVQLPGRQDLLEEEPFGHMVPLVRMLASELRSLLDVPFAFFGHSMGALVAFELARELRRQGQAGPVHLFVAAQRAPQLPRWEVAISGLPDSLFVAALKRIGGLPLELLQHRELMGLVLPALRADIEICESYAYAPGSPLDCAITAFGGRQDHSIGSEELAAWRAQTSGSFELRMLRGDHFFLERTLTEVVMSVVDALAQPTRGGQATQTSLCDDGKGERE